MNALPAEKSEQTDEDKNLGRCHNSWEHYYSRFQQDCRNMPPELRDLIHEHYWKQIKGTHCLKPYFMDYLR